MEEKKVTLVLSDGTELTGFTENGNNYITNTKIDEAVFTDKLETLTIKYDDGTERVLNSAYLVQQVTYDEGKTYWLCFAEKTEMEKLLDRIKANEDALDTLVLAGLEV